MKKIESGPYDPHFNPCNLVDKLSLHVRKGMFKKLMVITRVCESTKILDAGVTSDQGEPSNFLEKWYPYPENITASGIEDAFFLEKDYPGVKSIKADGKTLPFKDKSFDLVTSFAVIEHVGSRQSQQQFVQELCRVGKSCLVTTPNRWFPVDVHTMLPFLHWLPPAKHRLILSLMNKNFFAKEENLNLMDAKTLRGMFPPDMQVSEHHTRLLGMVSNHFFYAKSAEI